MDDLTQGEVTALLDALRAAQSQEPEDAKTTEEWRLSLGWGPHKMRAAIKSLRAAGKMEKVTVMRPRMDDILTPVSAYRLVSEDAA